MVDLTEALKARIRGMSPEKLRAEVRRGSSVSPVQAVELEAVWETAEEGAAASSRTITVRLDDASQAGSDDTMVLTQGSSFRETIILDPSTYRLLAGGRSEDGKNAQVPTDCFIITSGKPGVGQVSTERGALLAHVESERPLQVARARRLLDLERSEPATLRLAAAERVALFAARWKAEALEARINDAVAYAPSRAMLLMAQRDHVALRLRREDLEGSRLLHPELAEAILLPKSAPAAAHPLVASAPDCQGVDPYRSSTHGSGPERMLLLDLSRFRKAVQTLASEDEQNAAVTTLAEMVGRSALLTQEQREPLACRSSTTPLANP